MISNVEKLAEACFEKNAYEVLNKIFAWFYWQLGKAQQVNGLQIIFILNNEKNLCTKATRRILVLM